MDYQYQSTDNIKVHRNNQRLLDYSQSYRDYLTNENGLPSGCPRRNRDLLAFKYHHYRRQGHLILAVTLSTFVNSDGVAHSELMRLMWDDDFIHRVRRSLPRRAPLDHDYRLEPYPHWHFHGLLAVKSEHAHRLWNNGQLNRRLSKSVESFKNESPYRVCRINSFDITPVRDIDSWCNYISKQSESIGSSEIPHVSIIRRSNTHIPQGPAK